MTNKLNELNQTLLMGPGPSCVSKSVYQALAKPTLGHLDPNFISLMDEIKISLQKLFNTNNRLTIPISGTGSAGMEACFVNLIEPGDNVLILINGVFGGRMEDIALRLGANVDSINFDWGTPVLIDQVNQQLKKKQYNIVAVVHAETSTGVCNPIKNIGELVSNNGALYLVDSVTSLGGMNLKMDEWKIDAIYSGTQKCLSCPPGLSPISFSDRAVEKLSSRKIKVPNWYLDLTMIINYWDGNNRAYHHTAPINMLYGLYQACFNILEEGLQNVIKRHDEMHKLLINELSLLGLDLLVEESARLPMLNAIMIPDEINDIEFRSNLINKFNIEIGGGLGPLAGKIWRIGLMGETAKKESIYKLIDAFKKLLI
tara:strand:- start:1851 stop:2963 length:1113 start_codon:yes stop_codon:yes gene_type:complete